MLNFRNIITTLYLTITMVIAMAMDATANNTTTLDQSKLPRWDLTDLYKSQDLLASDITKMEKKMDNFAAKYRGKVVDFDADTLVAAIKESEEIVELVRKLGTYAFLQYVVDMHDAEKAAFNQKVSESINNTMEKMIFFNLELQQIDDAKFAELMKDENVAVYSEPLLDMRKRKPFVLSEPEEVILSKTSIVSGSAWVRLFDETMAGLRYHIDDKDYNITELSQMMSDKDEGVRKKAYKELARVLHENQKLLVFITNTLAKEKQISDELRGYSHVMQSRNLSNGIEGDVVDNLMQSVKDKYATTSHRYFAWKAKDMGKERLDPWDRNAPLPDDDTKVYSWDEARDIVLEAYTQFSPKMAEIGQKFFDNNWIDVPVVDGKRFGAFAHPAATTAHPYLLLNYQGKLRDVMTLAHELGHGVHQYLAAAKGPILDRTPLTLAETASVFAEQLTFRKLLADTDAEGKKLLLSSKIEDMLNTVVRQIAFAYFEKEVHESRKNGELSAEQLSEIWVKTQADSFGDAIVLDDDYKHFWSYIPHFKHSPFYVYSYAFGDCLVNTLYMQYQKTEDKAEFADKYLDLLAAGGSQPYTELLSEFDLDPSDPEFWYTGLSMIESMIDELEAL